MPELSPGSVGRRTLPEYGEKKLREKIHRESKFTDEHKNLPYTFSKPSKPKKHGMFECENCGRIAQAPKNTIMIICRGCGQASKVKEL